MIRTEDIQLEQNCPEETVAPSQVWREKIVIHEEEAPPESPTTPPSESQDDWKHKESYSEDLKTSNALPSVPQSFIVYLSSTEFKDQNILVDGGHPNRCQGAADFQIHLHHLLATSEEIMSKSSLGESTPIFLAKCFYSRLYFTQIIKRSIIIKNPNKDFVLLYIPLLNK